MPQIYEYAVRVVVWLGNEYENSGAAIDFLQESRNVTGFDVFLQEFTRKEAFIGVVHLMKRPWFTRRWVIQEISCSRSAHLYCGAADMPWHAFVDAITLIAARRDSLRRVFSSLLANDPDDFESFNSLSTLKFLHLTDNMFRKTVDGRITQHLMTLEALLATTPQFESTDPEDTVYALLFLASDAEATTYEDWLEQFRRSHSGGSWDREIQPHTGGSVVPVSSAAEKPNEPATVRASDEPAAKRRRVLEEPKNEAGSAFIPRSQKKRNMQRLGYVLVRYLGLETYGNRRVIMVDYRKSILEICRDLMKFIITHSESSTCSAALGPLQIWIYHLGVNADPLVGNPLSPVKPYMVWSTTAKWAQQVRDLGSLDVQGFVLDRIRTKEAVATAGIVPMAWTKMAGWMHLNEAPPEIFWRTLVGNRSANGQRAPFHWGQVCAAAFARRPVGQDLDANEAVRHGCPEPVRVLLERVQSVVWSRRLIRLGISGELGLTAKSARKGDLLCILKGCSVPVVLREFYNGSRAADTDSPDPMGHFKKITRAETAERQPKAHYEFIGEAYIHGLMDGEALDRRNALGILPHSFSLR